MKKRILYIVVLAATILVACKKNYLDRYSESTISDDLYFNTEEDLSLYVYGLLSLDGTSQYLEDQESDNAATTAAVEIKTIMTGSPSSQTITTGWSTSDWSRLRDINYFLDNYNKADVTQNLKDHYAGLARYYRAVFYMVKVKRYSDVPWFSTTVSVDDSLLYKARDPRTLVIDSVIADLSFAAYHVQEDVATGTPNDWAVKAFYARMALYEGTFRKYHPELGLESTAARFLDTAVTISQQIMNSGKFSVYSTGNPESDYAQLFSSQDLLSNSEVILARPYDASISSNGSVNSTVFGDYEQSPSRNLVQTYLMKDGTSFTDQPGYDTFTFVHEFQDRDPRMQQSLAYPGFIKASSTTPYIQRLNKNFTGYHQLKGYVNTTDGTEAGSVDFPMYRYAETLLTFAEAKAELGTLTQGDLDNSVNLLRTRAGMPQLNFGTANSSPDPVLAAQYPDVSGNKGVLLEIRRERRVEMALEGYRFDDLMRWHAGSLLTVIPIGMYFPGIGKYDLTGDGIPDIMLIDKDTAIPNEDNKEKNSLGTTLVYYKAGTISDNVTVYLENGNNGGHIVTETTTRTFIEPKYYYRPIPYEQMILNPNLTQLFGWD